MSTSARGIAATSGQPPRPGSARQAGRRPSNANPRAPAGFTVAELASPLAPLNSAALAPATASLVATPLSGGAPAGTRVRVSVRIRPFNSSDMNDATVAVRRDGDDSGTVLVDDGKRGRSFTFDHLFTDGQKEVYDAIGEPMLTEAYNGFNVCLFAYGQTGSGKTYSIQGGTTSEEEGIVPRLVRDLFAQAQRRVESDPGLTIKVTMSFLEVYNEKVRDLLVRSNNGSEAESLELLEDADRRVSVKGLGVHSVLGADRVAELLRVGHANRQSSETRMNEQSSRSHAVLQLTVSQLHDSMDRRDLESTVTLVDLAGSERQGKTESEGVQFQEAKKINLSLLTLGRAIKMLSEGRPSDFVTLRDSKLTRLLAESFGGNSKTWMLATVAPSGFNVVESLSTLDYASSAKNITNRAHINKVARQLEMKQLKELCVRMEASLETERARIKELEGAQTRFEREVATLREETARAEETAKHAAAQAAIREELASLIFQHDEIRADTRDVEDSLRAAKARAASRQRDAKNSNGNVGQSETAWQWVVPSVGLPMSAVPPAVSYVGVAACSLRRLLDVRLLALTLPLRQQYCRSGKSVVAAAAAAASPISATSTPRTARANLPPLLHVTIRLVDQAIAAANSGGTTADIAELMPPSWVGKPLVEFAVLVERVESLPDCVVRAASVSYRVKRLESIVATTDVVHENPRNALFHHRQSFVCGPPCAALSELMDAEEVLLFEVHGF